MTENLDQELTDKSTVRPTFLTVLCILTFIGAGFAIISAIYSLLTYESSMRTLESMQDTLMRSGRGIFDDLPRQIQLTKKWGRLSYTISCVGAILCLLGALRMWKLRKTGFFMYTAGQIMPLFIGFGLMGGASTGIFGILTVIAAVFHLAFLVMYATNLKHLQ